MLDTDRLQIHPIEWLFRGLVHESESFVSNVTKIENLNDIGARGQLSEKEEGNGL